jgi:hypothetical protein
MSKNAGKTTVLNSLLKYYTEKPRIFVSEGTLFTAAAGLLSFCDVTKEILMTTGINTPLGEVIILRARSGGYIQLAGPSINAQTARMCKTLQKLGAQTVIVDGAFSRKTLASPAVTESTILCAGASLGKNMLRVVDETRHVHDLLKSEKTGPELERFTEEYPLAVVTEDGDCKGFDRAALTDAFADELLRQGVKNAVVAAGDASKFLIKPETYQRLALKNIKLRVRNVTNLIAVTINPVSSYGYEFNAGDFKDALAQAIDTPVVNVMGEENTLYDLLV